MWRVIRWVFPLLMAMVAMIAMERESEAQEYPSVRAPLAEGMSSPGDVAFVVSVEDYFRLPAVPGARETGRDWVSYFRDGLGVDRVYDLIDQEATVETVKRFAEQAAGEVGEGATLWFVFVGHGAPAADGSDGLLVGVDAQQNLDSLMARSVPQRELMEILESGNQGQTVAFVDACFSGRDGEGSAIVPGLQPVLPVAHQPRMGSRSVVLSAAGSDEFAGPLPGADRPAFSYWMLGALRGWAGQDGVVTAEDALGFTRDKLRSVSGMVQTPGGHGDLNLVLVRGVQEADPLPGWDGRQPSALQEETPGDSATGVREIPDEFEEEGGPYELSTGSDLWRVLNRNTGEAMRGAGVYRMIGRDDLAEKYEENEEDQQSRMKLGRIVSLSSVGGAALGVGLVSYSRFGTIDAGSSDVAHCGELVQELAQQNCIAQQHYDNTSAVRISGLALLGAGLAGAVVGEFMRYRARKQRIHPLSPRDAHDLVETINRQEISLDFTPYFSPGTDSEAGVTMRLQW